MSEQKELKETKEIKVDITEAYAHLNDPSYEDNSNWLSWVTVSFMSKIFGIGKKRSLAQEDLGGASKHIDASTLFNKFETEYKKQSTKPTDKRSIFKPIVKATNTYSWVTAVIVFLIVICLTFLPTLIMKALIKDLSAKEGSEDYLSTAARWIYIVGLLVIPIINALGTNLSQLLMTRIGVQMKSMASEALYRKALTLSSTAKGQTSTGQVVNIMSTDTNMLQMFTMFAMQAVSAPIMIVVAIVLIYMEVHNLTWIAVGILLLMLIIQAVASSFAHHYRTTTMQATDARIKLLNEILTGIRVIKYYCWEKPFIHKVDQIRRLELKRTQINHWLMTICFHILMQVVPYIIPFVLFAVYPYVEGKPLTPATAFTTISLLSILKAPFMMLPMCINMLIQFNVALQRINRFLSLDDVDPDLVIRVSNTNFNKPIDYKDREGNTKQFTDYNLNETPIVIHDGDFAWGDNDNVLHDINVKIKKGSLVAVVGRVGSGKTSFVSTLIGEMTKNSGTCMTSGSIAYASQQAWLINDTVRGNIIFGKPFDEQKYKNVIKTCCMEDDLKVLKGGDMCEIGDRGINLSGGQKARIALARCLYSDCDIMIMDDPIAAVDSHVGKYIFNKCIHKGMEGKTRILVTNAVQYLPKCDHIIILDDNTIKAQGTYEEIKAMNIDVLTLIEEGSKRSSDGLTSKRISEDKSKKSTNPEQGDSKGPKNAGGLTENEEKEQGKIPFSVYLYYFKSAGAILIATLILFLIINQISAVWSYFILAEWSETTACANVTSTANVTQTCSDSNNYYMLIYGIFVAIICISCIICVCVIIPARITASKRIHRDLTNVVMAAPVGYFDVTPVGRILNRFNKDMNYMDEQLPQTFQNVINMMLYVIGDCVQISISTYASMIPFLIIIIAIFYWVQSYFRHTNTDTQRLESLSRSPIFEDFQAILGGAPTIRAYGYQDRFINNVEKKIKLNNHDLLLYNYCGSWLSVRTDSLAGCISFFIAVMSQLLRTVISPGLLGVALNAASDLTGYLKQWTRMMAQMEAQMNSVERIRYYIDHIEPEAAMIIPDHRPPENWPSEGAIQFDNYEMRYRNGPKVLKGVNLDIKPQEKIGVVGRTGAGKSSLMVGLFRISEPCGGALYMDNINLSEIGLEDVRKHLCIIPQDPVLFSASVRFNLDPFDESTDDEIWSVLEEVELKEVIEALPKKLEDEVHEGGSNFSVGQRQLICMARALLKHPKVLIMDEATASLDNETDAFLQKMIRKQFKNCTVLTIAHRLNTIMDSTRVCVMDQGVVAEFDTPVNLLNNPNSIFSGMVKAANDTSLYKAVSGYTGVIPKSSTTVSEPINTVDISPIDDDISTPVPEDIKKDN